MKNFKYFEYGIKVDGRCIAVFLNPTDRDYAMDALETAYDDYEFESVDNWATSVATESD